MKTKLISIAAGCCLAGGLGLGNAHAAPGTMLMDPTQPALDCGIVHQTADQVTSAFTQLGMGTPGVMVIALAVATTRNLPLDGVLGCLKT